MSDLSDEISRYAQAERQFGDEAGPLIAAIIRSIQARAGLCITEIRVTVDWASCINGSIPANCTIVRAHDASPAERHNSPRTTERTEAPGGSLSSNQD
jgi:hypothetical protein